MITSRYEILTDYIYVKRVNSLAITTVDPLDSTMVEIEGVAAEMFLGLVELRLSTGEVVQMVQSNYQVEAEVIEKDLEDLIKFLLEKKIIKPKLPSAE